jgi:Ni/Fe-hydrogenase subunit HybB-like protein
MSDASHQTTHDTLLRPLFHTSWRFYALVALLGSVVFAALVGWFSQMYFGIGLAGINWPVFWGFYIVNFVFWIGISHAGTLISAILRLVNAGWRRPVTRCAEAITVFALTIGAMFPLIHLGRPWLFFWMIPYPSERLIWPNIRSPLVWDFFAINTYLLGSTLFLLLPMIPDFAAVRDRSSGVRKRIYRALAFGWRGTPREWHRLETAMQIMAVAIIPVAVSVHTIVSFDFSMAPVPMWHTTIFGPYFVAGAIFSGIAALIIAMAVLRKFLRLEEYLRPIHFQNLGKLLLVMSLLWGYFVFNERLVVWYGNHTAEIAVFETTQSGTYAPLFWTMVFANFVLPLVLMGIRRFRTITGCVIASLGVVLGMWLERYLIVVPSLSHKYLPFSWGSYQPQPVEILATVATFAAMILLYLLFTKVVPIISIWELKAGEHPVSPETVPTSIEPLSVQAAAAHDVYALYPDGASAQQAVDALRAAGVPDRDITVISGHPIEEYEFGSMHTSTWMWWFACAGGLIGMLAGYGLVWVTQTSWPLTVGGMREFAWWPSLIIIFELTMLGAIVATAIALLVSAGLPGRGRKLYDPEVTNGRILVGVQKPPGATVPNVQRALEVGPGAVVKTA